MKDLTEKKATEVEVATDVPMGFDEEDSDFLIIPRIKMVQTLSPERKDKQAVEGDIINSLTKEKYTNKKFIPVFQFANNVEWRDRSEGGGIKCIARDGKMGEDITGKSLLCAACKRCEFDNTKTGKESLPKCTKYLNFFGFFEGERMPIIMSFGKTNYYEGKKLYSLAKVTMQNMWNYGYSLTAKLMAKGGNEWYIIVPVPAGASTEDDRAFAQQLYTQYRNTIQNVRYDMEENAAPPEPDVKNTEF